MSRTKECFCVGKQLQWWRGVFWSSFISSIADYVTRIEIGVLNFYYALSQRICIWYSYPQIWSFVQFNNACTGYSDGVSQYFSYQIFHYSPQNEKFWSTLCTMMVRQYAHRESMMKKIFETIFMKIISMFQV